MTSRAHSAGTIPDARNDPDFVAPGPRRATTALRRAAAASVLTLAFSGSVVTPPLARAEIANVWYASRSASARANWLIGETRCDPLVEGDCNPCLPDVEEQFARALGDDEMDWLLKHWDFASQRNYVPDRLTGDDAYRSGPEHHVQGFVRTNDPRYQFAVTHAGNSIGSLSIVAQDEEGKKHLRAIHRTQSAHPGSVAAIGKYVVFPDVADLSFFDVTRPTETQEARHPLPGPTQLDSASNGGVGMARLSGGGHLVAFVTGGQSSGSNRRTVFVYHEGPFEDPNRMEFLGEYLLVDTLSASPSSIKTWEGARFPENMSMITECGTGTLYTVHLGAATHTLNGDGAINLARVDWNENGPYTTTVGLWKVKQVAQECYFRGGASAGSVDYWKPGALRILCHERGTVSYDYFNFKEGTLEP